MPHVHILGTHDCGNSRQYAFNWHADFDNVLWHRYYTEHLVVSFAHQIQSEYYGGNRSVSIKVIAFEHLSASGQEISSSTLHSCKRHAVFHHFLPDNSKQDTAATTAHTKSIIELLKSRQLFFV